MHNPIVKVQTPFASKVGRPVLHQKGLLGIREVKRTFLGIKRSRAFGWMKTSFAMLFGYVVSQPDREQPTPIEGYRLPYCAFCKLVLVRVSNVQIQWH